MVVIELERVVIKELQQQLPYGHRVLLRVAAQQIQMLRTVEIGVVQSFLVAFDRNLWPASVARDWTAVPVGRKFLRVRTGEKKDLKDGEQRRTDCTLKEMDEHEDVSVGAERFVGGIVDVIGLRPK